MIEFAAAVLFLLISPGPGVLTTAGIGAAFGFRSGLNFILGLMLGGFLTMMIVVSGLAAVILAIPLMRAVLLVVSVAYLTYLAWRIASAGSKVGFAPAMKPLGFINGLTLQFINPKAYIVATTLFAGFAFMPDAPGQEIIVKLILFNAICLPVHLVWLGFGTKVGQLNLGQTGQRRINYAMAGALMIVVVIALIAV